MAFVVRFEVMVAKLKVSGDEYELSCWEKLLGAFCTTQALGVIRRGNDRRLAANAW